jgi:hypothetical protein
MSGGNLASLLNIVKRGFWCPFGDGSLLEPLALSGSLQALRPLAKGTRITDRSLEILGRMQSLEKIDFCECAGITDAGVALLAGLPRLRAITVGGSPNVTRKGMAVFPSAVRVNYW